MYVIIFRCNPISPTNLCRAILRIANEEGLNLPKEVLDSLASNSHGDIRAAVNGLQFAYSKGKVYTIKMPSELWRSEGMRLRIIFSVEFRC